MIMKGTKRRKLKRVVVPYLKVLSHHLPQETEENHKRSWTK